MERSECGRGSVSPHSTGANVLSPQKRVCIVGKHVMPCTKHKTEVQARMYCTPSTQAAAVSGGGGLNRVTLLWQTWEFCGAGSVFIVHHSSLDYYC